MSRFIVVAALVAAAWGLVATGEAKAGYWLDLAAQADRTADNLERQGDRTTAKRYRDAANLYRQYARAAGETGGTTTPPKPAPPKPAPPKPDPFSAATMQARANSAADAALALVRKYPRAKTFTIYYRESPIYQGQDFGSQVKTWRVQAYEVVRVITSLKNNRKLIVNPGVVPTS